MAVYVDEMRKVAPTPTSGCFGAIESVILEEPTP